MSPQAIDRLFDRLSLTYGAAFMRLYEGFETNAVKSSWAHELSGFANRLDCVAWALENLPARCPNVIEFRALCRSAPLPDANALPAPPAAPADPERVKREMAKLAMLKDAPKVDNREWARRLIQRHESGAYKSTPAALEMARDALKGLS